MNASSTNLPEGVEIQGTITPEYAGILTPEAVAFVAALNREFGARRRELLARREQRQAELDSGRKPNFLSETDSVREGNWMVAPTPTDLQKRWVEITGPVERKMIINALNSGADVFMADFEDANSPTWDNNLMGHLNLRDAIRGTISYSTPEGKFYKLNDEIAVLMVRPRGWHLPERHMLVDGEAVSGSLFDFGLFFFHNARELIDKGTGPYFYLPKLESHLEARLWNDVFQMAQDTLGIPRGTIRATVLIENILAAFEMEEILYELRDHAAGLNAGRWDYIFSIIRKFRDDPSLLLPDRSQITMTVPFMRVYTELLVKSCHKHGAHAMGGMSAFIPNRKDAQVNAVALEKVREDKERESTDGFDGTWVAHPDLVPIARVPFAQVLGDRPNQKERMRPEVQVRAEQLLDFRVPGGEITENGLRHNINVGLQYLEAWLGGNGSVPIYNLMEDAATAEISRAQVWQWLHRQNAALADGRKVTYEMFCQLVPEELDKIKGMVGDERFAQGNYRQSAQIFDRLASSERFVDFLTLAAYDWLP